MGCASSLATQTKLLKGHLPTCETQYLTKVDQLPLTETQKYYIKQSWMGLESNKGELGIEIFLRLFSENPTLQLMFPEFREYSTLEELKESRSLQGHTKRVMKVVENAVNSLEDGHALMEYLQELGRRHKTRQIKPTVSNLQEISQAINETFEENLGIKWTVEIAESWKLLLDYVMAMIIRGLRSP